MKYNAFRQRYHARGSGLVWNASIRRRKGTGGPVTPEITFDELVASLLSAGETVAFYDPNDLTSVYTARTGGANAVADGPVGLMLDKAQMGGLTAAEYLAALDTPELVTNGTFDTDTSGWTLAAGGLASVSSGILTLTNDTNRTRLSQFVTTQAGKRYKFTITGVDLGNSPAGSARMQWGAAQFLLAAGENTILVSASGVSTEVVVFQLTTSSGLFFSLDNITVQEIPGYHATAPSDAARPILRDVSSTYALDFDNVDDAFAWTTPAITDGTWIALTRDGSYAASAAYSAGTYTMPQYQPFDLCAILWTSADLTTVQEAIVLAEGSARGAAADFGGVASFAQGFRSRTDLRDFPTIDTGNGTSFQQAWQQCTRLSSFPLLDVSSGASFFGAWIACTGLTSFPALDVSSGTNFSNAWNGCSSLTSFPLLDVSSAITFLSAWRDCTSLANFPANMFDTCPATNFTSAFFNTNLSQTSIDNILTSINTANTSNGTFTQSGGSAPSATGEAAIDDLVSRGWTVTVTGGYVARTILTRSGQAIFDRSGSYIKERAV
jgi:hypothetical protein